MRADNTEHLRQATLRRSEDARHRAHAALQELQAAGTPISVTLLAHHAHVARSWIYTQPDLLELIRRAPNSTPARTPPPTAATEASWQRRLELAHSRIKELTNENKQLRHQLALVYGQRRAEPSSQKTPSTTQTSSSEATTTR